jgi:hypothetical protein
MQIVPYFSIFNIYQQGIKVPSSKSAIPLSYVDIKLAKLAYPDMPRVIKERLISPPEGICVNRNNFARTLNEKVMNALITAGIPQHLYKFTVEFELKSPPDPPRGPKVFDVEDLKFGFMIWLATISISIASFFAEVIFHYILKLFLNTLGIFSFLKIFKLKIFSQQ